MSSQDDNIIAERLERWRRNLIDTSQRNRLISFTESSGVLRLSRPEGPMIYDRLVTRGEELEIGLDEDGMDPSGMLLSDRGETVVDRTLLNLRLKAREAQREQGINILFLSIGILEWRDAAGQGLRSPLILIPVELRRTGALHPYRVATIDEGAVVNPILAHRLRTEYSLELPTMPSDPGPGAVEAVMRQISDMTFHAGWTVAPGNYLGLFYFAKMVMYEELMTYGDLARGHPVVRALAGCRSDLPMADEIPVEELDGSGQNIMLYQMLDADSSQQEALALARRGVSFVLQGPPGTGKSQTIANMIAETLATGRTVLFVSEKMAALEVVRGRLDERGLGEHCMELHSRKANRKEVMAGLRRGLQPRDIIPTTTGVMEELVALRRRLDRHVDALHEVRPGIGVSLHHVNSELAGLRAAPDLAIHLPNLHRMSIKDLESIGPMVREMERDMHLLRERQRHPWTDCTLDTWKVSALPELESILTSCQSSGDDSLMRASSLAERFGSAPPTTLAGVTRLVSHLRLAMSAPRPLAKWLADPRTPLAAMDELREGYRILDEGIEDLRARYDEGILSLDLEGIGHRMGTVHRSILRWLRPSYRRDMKALARHRSSSHKLSLEEAAADVSAALSVKRQKSAIAELEKGCSSHLGEHFFGRSTDWGAARQMLEWCDSYRLKHGTPTPPLVRLMTGEDGAAGLSDELDELEKSASLLDDRMGAATASFDLTALMAGRPLDETGIGEIISWARAHLDTLEKAQEWVRVNHIRQGCARNGLHELFSMAEEGRLPAEGLWDALRKRYYSLWHDHILSTDSRLRDLGREEHARAVERFRLLDRQQLDIAAERLQAMLQGRRKALLNDTPPSMGTSLWMLRHEVNRKKGLRPLRELFSRAGDAILQLKPCLLMSPLSVSMHLDPSRISFDLVIFDEASQIRPEDAIGSIMRGRQVIIVGDTMQLPPTDFFRGTNDEDEDMPDLESILDEGSSCLPQRMLRWHYRSEDESLIAFSNLNFYDGQLFTFPSPDRIRGGGVSFSHVPEGCYDRGSSRRNVPEAVRVVDMVVRHFQEQPELSLGVVAFSEAQQMAVLEELESRVRDWPELAGHLKEGIKEEFFVKNLESIQGDERDVILLSLGYGKDAKGKMHQSLGPLNRAGGERRLNVAITRARRSLTLVSSILPSDLHPTSTGARLLKRFMEYAIAGGVRDALPAGPGSGTPSPLETIMVKALEEKGLEVTPRLGCSGYRIDMAVGSGGDMSLAVETDGPTYRSGVTARDRERLRQEMLSHLGWTVYRTWSSDWVRDPTGEVRRIMKALKAAEEVKAVEEKVDIPITVEIEDEGILQESEVPMEVDEGDVSTSTLATVSPLIQHAVVAVPYERIDWNSLPGLISGTRTDQDWALEEAMVAVVTVEGPVHPSVVHERILELYRIAGFRRGAGKAEEARAIERLNNKGRVVRRGDFLWPQGIDEPSVRSSSHKERRELWHVCMEELKAAIMHLLDDIPIDERELVSMTTTLYGYKRPSPEARCRILEAVEGLIGAGLLVRIGESIGKVH